MNCGGVLRVECPQGDLRRRRKKTDDRGPGFAQGLLVYVKELCRGKRRGKQMTEDGKEFLVFSFEF
jgi:chloramphenicol 3-O-phosphotransferase